MGKKIKSTLTAIALLGVIGDCGYDPNFVPTALNPPVQIVEEESRSENQPIQECFFEEDLPCTIDLERVSSFLDRKGIEHLPLGTFEDTKRPNAVVAYPCSDISSDGERENNAFYISGHLLRTMYQNYDVNFVLVRYEKEFYGALISTPDISAVVVAGHGTQTSLRFSQAIGIEPAVDERTTLDVGDDEISNYLGNLLPDVRWFNFSCSNGRGGEDTKNLGSMIRYNLQNVAPSSADFFGQTSFSESRISVVNAYHLNVLIMRNGDDVTITNSADECSTE
ncbi:hypothetical protein HOI26_05320 [Candidatus Woesearchaeota archaeon]|jgi:hypothetical protein|nr:hypothetical protein [Candidatus Woesearchaeota archaeon]MBT5740487.1 hypothetical protein [Candidatus Woesearchaeota archaeon]